MDRKKPSIVLIIVLLITVVLAGGAGFAVKMRADKWNEFKLNAKPVTAYVTDIKTRRTGTGKHRKTSHTVRVQYTVDNVNYDTTLDYYSSTMHKGTAVELYFDPQNPADAMSDPTRTNIIIGSVEGLIMFAVAAFVVNDFKKCAKINRVIAEGKYYICDDWTEQNSNMSVNHVRYHCIRCVITDDRGKEFVCFSEPFHPAKSPYQPGDKIKVYADPFEGDDIYYVSKEPVRYDF